MTSKGALLLLVSLALVAPPPAAARNTLIVVALPGGAHRTTYACQLGGTLDGFCHFILDYARAVAQTNDRLAVIYPTSEESECMNRTTVATLRSLGVVLIPVSEDEAVDCWMRDFGLGFGYASDPVKFRYDPQYLYDEPGVAEMNSQGFMDLLNGILEDTDTRYWIRESDVALDGGNIVDNLDETKAIMSERMVAENPDYWDVDDVIAGINDAYRGVTVCPIPDPGDSTGHSDGLVSFVDTNTVIVANYGDAEATAEIVRRLRKCYGSQIEIHIMDNKVFDLGRDPPEGCDATRFTSATGSTINMLCTHNACYAPSFASAGFDNSEQLEFIRARTSKDLLTVDTARISFLGGSVRCLSWQIAEEHPIAQAIFELYD